MAGFASGADMTASSENQTAAALMRARDLVVADDALLAGRLREGMGQDAPAGQIGAVSTGFADLFHAAGGEVPGGASYRLALEFIFEGYLLHHGASRLFGAGTEELDLLAGDYMYARGLGSIAELGDLDCIRMLADLITVCSQVHCEGLPRVQALAAWTAVTLALARHAAGGGDAQPREAGAPGRAAMAVAAMKRSFQEGSPAAEETIEELLAGWPAETAAGLRQLSGNIYKGYHGHR